MDVSMWSIQMEQSRALAREPSSSTITLICEESLLCVGIPNQ
jgi:hypothetical protein